MFCSSPLPLDVKEQELTVTRCVWVCSTHMYYVLHDIHKCVADTVHYTVILYQYYMYVKRNREIKRNAHLEICMIHVVHIFITKVYNYIHV